MTRKQNRLYGFLALACLAGYSWLLLIHLVSTGKPGSQVVVCLIKYLTHFPCPSCGLTRALLALVQGNVTAALYWNPIGLPVFAMLVLLPLWLAFDLVCKKQTLFKCYHQMEQIVNQRKIAIPLILLMLGNWIWNIYKGL